jgi:hypothetical protein
VVLVAALAVLLWPLEPGALALQFAFTPRAFAQVIHAWSPEQLARYRWHLPFDAVLLVSYGAFGYLWAARGRTFAGRSAALRRWARWALPLAAAFDAVENALHAWLTDVPRFGVQWPYVAAAAAATLKWALALAYALTVAYALARVED